MKKQEGHHQDISQRQQVEESLKQSEQNFHFLTEAIPQIIWTADGEGKPDFFNQRWYDYTGMRHLHTFTSSEDVIAESFSKVHPEDQERLQEIWTQAISQGDPFEAEYRLRNAMNGTYRWHLARGTPMRGEDHKIVKWFGTCTDIDDYKRIQHTLQETITDIKEMSIEREKLVASEKAAVEASRLKSDFLANISHEIRTPLNGILGMTSLMLETVLTDEQKDHMNVIYESGQGLLGLINDILDFSKIEAGKLVFENIDFSLKEVLQGVTKVLSYSAKSKKISLKLNIERLPAVTLGDPTRIRQILFNLVHNAIKFTSEGSVEVIARILSEEESHYLIRIEVRDTGIGIQENDQARIFTPFMQADASTTRKYGGTGLGLSICKWVTDHMGGSIGFDSEVDHGSTFWIEIPLRKSDLKHLSQLKDKEKKEVPLGAEKILKSSAKLRILVAEDHLINQKFIQRVIEKMGFEVSIVENGQQAVAALESKPYDLVLMDCHMPVMDGFEATQKIRTHKNPVLHHIPIIALTANVVKGTRERCLNTGMNDYLTKPIEPVVLQKAIFKILHLKESSPLPSLDQENLKKEDLILDKSALEKLDAINEAGKPDIVVELIRDYLHKTPEEISNLLRHIKYQDHHSSETLAHKLKSASGCIGASKMQNLCLQLEELSKKKTQVSFKVWSTHFNQTFKETEKALNIQLNHRENLKKQPA